MPRRSLFACAILATVCVRALAAADTSPSTTLPSAPGDVGRQAEEVVVRLRLMTKSSSDSALSALKAEVETQRQLVAGQWTQTGRLLEHRRRIGALDSLTSAWLAVHRQLEDLDARIAAPATHVEDDLKTLQQLRDSWSASLDLRRQAQLPPFVLQRTEATLAAIDAVRPEVEQRHTQVLVLQDEVNRLINTCEDALTRVQDVKRDTIAHLLTNPAPPVWSRRSGDEGVDAQEVSDDLAAAGSSLTTYARLTRGGLVMTAVLMVALALMLRGARPAIEGLAGEDAFFASAASVLRAPYTTTVLLAFMLSRPFRPDPPIALQQLSLILLLVMAMRVLWPFLGSRLVRPVYGLFGALAAVFTVAFFPMGSHAEQVASIAVLIAIAMLILWTTRAFRATWHSGVPAPWIHRLGTAVGRGLALGCLACAAASALGYVLLAEYVGVGLLFLALLTIVLPAVRVALGALVAAALVLPPLSRLRAVARHRRLIERRTERTLDVLVVVSWVIFALVRFDLLDPVTGMLRGILEPRLHLGELDFALGQALSFLAVVVGAYFTTRLVVFFLEEDVYSRMTLPRGVPYALSTITRYALLLAGFLFALGTLGLDLTRLTVLVSAFGVGIGFGLQEIINNFVSGLILLFERPVQVGDSVQVADLSGQVLRIGVRSSTVRTAEGAEVIVPNSKLLDEKLTNWTLSDHRRRVDLDVTVAWETDSERILALLVELASRDARVCAQPAPEALLVRFGDASADFQLRVWTEEANWARVRSDLGIAVQRALRALRPEGVAPPRKS